MDKRQTLQERLARRRTRWLIRSTMAAIGIAAGYFCPMLPEEKQIFCHFAAKVVALFAGTP